MKTAHDRIEAMLNTLGPDAATLLGMLTALGSGAEAYMDQTSLVKEGMYTGRLKSLLEQCDQAAVSGGLVEEIEDDRTANAVYDAGGIMEKILEHAISQMQLVKARRPQTV